MMSMEECFRGHGPSDPEPLSSVRMADAAGIVSVLRPIYDGSLWSDDQILAQRPEGKK